jgi:hypothetical protein
MEWNVLCIFKRNTMKGFYLFLIVLVAGCNQLPTQKDNLFIVRPRIKPIPDTSRKIPPLPPLPPPIQTYNLPFNIIVDSSGQLFYFQTRIYSFYCGTGIEWDTPPEFLDLHPKDIILLPEKGIEEFIKQNIELVEPKFRRVAIASLKDTVRSDGLVKVFKVLRDTSIHVHWEFWDVTQEERVVLDYKKRNEYYDANYIKWDSSEISLLPKINIMKFTPPKWEE